MRVEMSDELYFDTNGSTPVDERVLEAALAWMREGYANASASHPEGRRAAQAIARAREQIAAGIGCKAQEIFFTSGGSESNNWALLGSARSFGRGHLVSSAIEHKSVLSTLRELPGAMRITSAEPSPGDICTTQSLSRCGLRPSVSVSIATDETL